MRLGAPSDIFSKLHWSSTEKKLQNWWFYLLFYTWFSSTVIKQKLEANEKLEELNK